METTEHTQETTMPFMPMEQTTSNSDFMKWVISGEEIANQIEIQLSGKVWSYTDKKFIQATKPLLNKEGISIIKATIAANIGSAPSVNKFTDEREVRELVGSIWQNVIDMLYMNWRVWEIRKENLSFIATTIVRNTVYYAIKKAKEGELITLLKPTIKRVENINAPNQSKGGFGNFLNPLK